MAADPAFVDTNVLVYANQANALRHHDAFALLQQAESDGAEVWVSGQVLREYLAAVTRPQGENSALSMAIALERVSQFAERFSNRGRRTSRAIPVADVARGLSDRRQAGP